MNDIICAASVMCANLKRLEDDFKALEAAGCEELHFDIMDGLFVPNITLGFDFIKAARDCCALPCSAHLMVTRPERYIDRFAEAGSATITVHVEACTHPHSTLAQIRDTGAEVGLAVNPGTPLTKLDYLLDEVDRILVMTVNPGYAGQKIVGTAFERVRILKEYLRTRRSKARIAVDGNINVHHAARLAESGADIFVLGSSSIFNGHGDLQAALLQFRADVQRERKLA